MVINLNNPLDLKKLIEQNNCKLNSFVTCSIGYDDKIYILLNEKIPKRIDGMFVNTESNSRYSIIVVDVDWDQYEIKDHTFYNLGKHEMNFHMVQPIENNILLLGARCYNDEKNGPEKNAIIVNYSGNILKEYCLGDGINDCIVCKNGNIITSYFDEGIFGNYGWYDPIGSNGLIVWNKNGEIIWEANNDIVDCYAINIDENENLWYYYYIDFDLIKTDMKTEEIISPQIEGSTGFLITSNGKNIIFEGGYDNNDKFLLGKLSENEISQFEDLELKYNNEEIKVNVFDFKKSKALFIDENSRLFIKKF